MGKWLGTVRQGHRGSRARIPMDVPDLMLCLCHLTGSPPKPLKVAWPSVLGRDDKTQVLGGEGSCQS